MDDLEAVITNGPYFDILNPDSYIELDVHMACDLNMDWFIYENYKYYCCLLLAGAILLDGEKGILINTIEVYGRTSLIDPYYERFLNGKEAITKTLLPSTGLIYNDVFVTVKKEDGSRKLIIATKSMNALVTSSIRIDQEVLPEVGSSILQFMPSTNTRIYILSSQLYDCQKGVQIGYGEIPIPTRHTITVTTSTFQVYQKQQLLDSSHLIANDQLSQSEAVHSLDSQ
ncbi:hypothetical protein G6F16_011469 [Rhizopus arrhizus]|uniref:Uncharacterized protein n=1 Tax=Rhizopus oryzae TaxID=64495 RepID=A0A9P6WZP3_RHIOR|nr:hypothetical protein G6F24_011298 [Rhizopus arrhizus]KAG0776305.1 hypothetical protein G6F22_012666 [Rhizopus arrhizus]KAG0782371.1 hypothetical protein G6F21_011150 [Rhizopus arrhizus]KAG0806104.1 hypothetical protein G6F20_011390 [Rhizopus arrhizus]KAG0822295.1 hypothetical protein G6F19_011458 [Rhizopus arrhizus]